MLGKKDKLKEKSEEVKESPKKELSNADKRSTEKSANYIKIKSSSK